MKLCNNCLRQAHGFGFMPTPLRVSDKNNQHLRRYFCSRKCQITFNNYYDKYNMIDITQLEKEAIESTLTPLAEYVSEVGVHKSINNYSREQILCLAEVIITAYWQFMQGEEDNGDFIDVNQVKEVSC